jgi:hypothetical protein
MRPASSKARKTLRLAMPVTLFCAADRLPDLFRSDLVALSAVPPAEACNPVADGCSGFSGAAANSADYAYAEYARLPKSGAAAVIDWRYFAAAYLPEEGIWKTPAPDGCSEPAACTGCQVDSKR